MMQMAQPHPTNELGLSTRKRDYQDFGLHFPKIDEKTIYAIVNSAAQCCLWGFEDFFNAGFMREDLSYPGQTKSAVSKIGIDIHGTCFLRLGGVSIVEYWHMSTLTCQDFIYRRKLWSSWELFHLVFPLSVMRQWFSPIPVTWSLTFH